MDFSDWLRAGTMLKIAFIFTVAALMLPQLASASYVSIIQPFNTTVYSQNAVVYIGKDGPGQTFYITISAATTNSTGVVNNLGWNKFVVTGLPQGWIAQNSSLYNPTLSVKITPSSSAPNGTYRFNLTAVNIGNYSKLGALRFIAEVNVTPDVFKLGVSPSTAQVSVSEPTDIYVSINNTGVSDSLFLISLSGLPAYNITQSVIALHHTTETFTYPVTLGEPGVYNVNISVKSVASPLIYKQSSVRIITQATLLNDYYATGSGIIAFPIVYEPVYAVMYLISLILRH